MRKLFIFLVLISFLSLGVFSQVKGGDIYGTVLLSQAPDVEGQKKPEVSITITGERVNTKVSIFLEKENGVFKGTFRFTDLQPGIYDLRFETEGYEPGIRKGIRVEQRRSTGINATMQGGLISVEITTAGLIEKKSDKGVVRGPMKTQLSDEMLKHEPFKFKVSPKDIGDEANRMLYIYRYSVRDHEYGVKLDKVKKILTETRIRKLEENVFEIQLHNIRSALLETGVDKAVFIEMQDENGKILHVLGNYRSISSIPDYSRIPSNLERFLGCDLCKFVIKNEKGKVMALIRFKSN